MFFGAVVSPTICVGDLGDAGQPMPEQNMSALLEVRHCPKPRDDRHIGTQCLCPCPTRNEFRRGAGRAVWFARLVDRLRGGQDYPRNRAFCPLGPGPPRDILRICEPDRLPQPWSSSHDRGTGLSMAKLIGMRRGRQSARHDRSGCSCARRVQARL